VHVVGEPIATRAHQTRDNDDDDDQQRHTACVALLRCVVGERSTGVCVCDSEVFEVCRGDIEISLSNKVIVCATCCESYNERQLIIVVGEWSSVFVNRENNT
jgi:hypothetical protein